MYAVALCVLLPVAALITTFSVDDVYNIPKDHLTLILMGDPQFYYQCERENIRCMKAAKRCLDQYGLNEHLRSTRGASNSTIGREVCIELMSRYSNRVQRQSLDRLINSMRYQPSALIINGDLTNFGHMKQFHDLQSVWMKSFPIPILPGLGNHDYENNINDCLFNFCAHTMLTWFTDFGTNNSLQMDYKRETTSAFDITFTGSFSYATRVCSVSGTNCAQVIQLNNAIDYEKEFSTLLVTWKIRSSIDFLKLQLQLIEDIDIPILINVHQNEGIRKEKMLEVITDWIYKTRSQPRKRIAVLYAHMHWIHDVRTYCIHGNQVPFVYVGSVPNNRYTMLDISQENGSIFGFGAVDAFEVGQSNSAEPLGKAENIWGSCDFPKYKHQTFISQNRTIS